MQTVVGNTLLAAKNRITTLQTIVKNNQLSMGDRSSAHAQRQQIAASNKMTQAEFLLLFPTAPVDTDFVTENAEIAAKQTALAAAIAARPPVDPGSNYYNTNIIPLQSKISELQANKERAISAYTRQAQKPERALTDAEFAQLYPTPSLVAEQTAIAAAQTECNTLSAFLKSGPYPNYPAMYDIDLLTGTAVSYP